MHQKSLSSDTAKQLQEELDGEQVRKRTANTLTAGDSTGNKESNCEFDVIDLSYFCNTGCTSSDLDEHFICDRI